jgi:glutamate-ammonia-ligase adenylyltransferase
VDPLARRLIGELERGSPPAAALALAGEPEPAQAAEALLRAARHPDLRAQLRLWAPALLRSARPGSGARHLVDVADRIRASGRRPLDLARAPAVPLVVGSSGFLARLLARRPEQVEELSGALPGPPGAAPVPADWSAIRRAKYQGLLRVAARDLLGRPFRESLGELSELADRCLRAALARASRETGTAEPALLALGKLGGRELNFSSDVDLLFLYDAEAGRDDLAHNEAVARLVRLLKRELEEPGAEGFAYRVDLDLRPEGRTGALANSVAAALGYYESFGQEWERQMLIRLRFVAGPRSLATEFAQEIAPFVYRRLIDPGVMHGVRAMKERIEAERRAAGRDLEASLKEGPGGIRDVEFLVQSLQLFHGGRHAALRAGNVLEALEALGALGLLPRETTASLADCYLWLRRAEHALQMAEEQRTSAFPRRPADQVALARRLGYADPEGERARNRLLDDWTAVKSEVRQHFEALVLSASPKGAQPGEAERSPIGSARRVRSEAKPSGDRENS